MGDHQQLSNDILIEIILRVPIKSVFTFKSVSKTWNSMLSDPIFIHEYENRLRSPSSLPLLGFFHVSFYRQFELQADEAAPRTSFLSSSTCPQGMRLKSHISFIDKLGFYIASSNGLILCGHHPTANYHVCNPVTTNCFSLPRPIKRLKNVNFIVGFSYQIHHLRRVFKVVRANIGPYGKTMNNILPIETYSSDTGVWKESTLTAPAAAFSIIPRLPCSAIRGVFYWRASEDLLVAYDNNTSKDQLCLIKLPHTNDSIILGESSSDGLLQCGLVTSTGFKIFVLAKKIQCYNYSSIVPIFEWNPKYSVDIYQTLGIWYPILRRGDFSLEGDFWDERRQILIAFHPQNSNIVYFRMGGNIIWYDAESAKILLSVSYGGIVFSLWLYNLFPYFQPDWPPSPFPL